MAPNIQAPKNSQITIVGTDGERTTVKVDAVKLALIRDLLASSGRTRTPIRMVAHTVRVPRHMRMDNHYRHIKGTFDAPSWLESYVSSTNGDTNEFVCMTPEWSSLGGDVAALAGDYNRILGGSVLPVGARQKTKSAFNE